ncbi:MAG TPA: helix-turn-helix transcriptional regulator [Pirellulales bacterium]|jgi:AraC-like DNA-binding protein|nr:helix-turn-helix transcriptional regulator [Pirellulales bacterium]
MLKTTAAALQWYDSRRGEDPVRWRQTELRRGSIEPPRTNLFQIYWIRAGEGQFFADAGDHRYQRERLLFFTPYQYLRFLPARAGHADVLQFHANFLCVETFHAETGCSGVLFNDPYGSPQIALDRASKTEWSHLLSRIRDELAARRLAYQEVLRSYVRALLIVATRRKLDSRRRAVRGAASSHPILEELREAIEANYPRLHAPADYAALLHVTPKTLGRIVRQELNKTLTNLIRDRLLIHAKWQLLHTRQPIKQISAELGFRDELYFSRLFKKGTGVSPAFFREFEWEIRGTSNLSIPSGNSPIQA